MKPIDVILVIAVCCLLFFAARRAIGSWSGKRDCCSGDKKSDAKRFPRVRIADTDESHYPYIADYRIGGMTCENCAENVTRALDSVKGTWATVDLDKKVAHVRCTTPLDEAAYSAAVAEAGYRLLGELD